MTEQLQLVPAPPRLTTRQQFALELLTNAAADGLTADEIGAAWCAHRGIHTTDTRCRFDGQTGNELCRALRAKGLARYRRARGDTPGAWLAKDAPAAPPRATRGMLPDSEPIPF